jgi:hypothetical protein
MRFESALRPLISRCGIISYSRQEAPDVEGNTACSSR